MCRANLWNWTAGLLWASLTALSLQGCNESMSTEEPGQDLPKSEVGRPVFDVRIEQQSAQCPTGGILVARGADNNRNNVLDPQEVTSSERLCSGGGASGGGDLLLSATPEPPGPNCAAGGQLLRWGRDANHDGSLGSGEVSSSAYVCNGAAGADGKNSLVTTTPEPPGEHCPSGGSALSTGRDVDGDNLLDPEEVESVAFVCSGAQGPKGDAGAAALIALDDEPAGMNCAYGGVRIRSGLDTDGDGALSIAETTQSRYVCNGGPAESVCYDRFDNDSDGLVDCADKDCNTLYGGGPFGGSCEFGTERTCFDGFDNDADGLVDCLDPDCDGVTTYPPYECQYRVERSCADGFDNDSDGVFDCADPDCDGVGSCEYQHERTCSDEIDNDRDGLTDCRDADCAGTLPTCLSCGALAEGATLFDLTKGASGTNYGPSFASGSCGGDYYGETIYQMTFPGDLDSVSIVATGPYGYSNIIYVRQGVCDDVSAEVACGGGGATFTPSPDALYYVFVDGYDGFTLAISGTVRAGGACNPSDQHFGCGQGYKCNGGICALPACSDHLDNDGDGRVDYPDEPGCESPDDNDETDPVPPPACADGIDNNHDGLTDYPADPLCSAASGGIEGCRTFGKDAFGYDGCASTAQYYEYPCDSIYYYQQPVCSGDDCVATVDLPFTFSYYGQDFTSLDISANGKIGLPASAGSDNACTFEPMTIAPFWDDLYPPGGGSIGYQTVGEAPSRRLVVSWNVPHTGGGYPYDVRAVLFEGTNRIRFCYFQTSVGLPFADQGASATAGISGPAGDQIVYSCNAPQLNNGLVLDFFPPSGESP